MSYISKYASMFPNYQRLGETLGQIKNQQWQGGAGAFGQLLQTLAQMQLQSQQKDAFENQGFNSGVTQVLPTSMTPPFQIQGEKTPNTDWMAKNFDNPFVQKYVQGQQAIQSLQPKQPEPFTLSPDQVRYGADGKPIAVGMPKSATEKQNLPEGFSHLVPEKKADVFNKTYGTNFTSEDFEQPPYYQPIIKSQMDEQGKTKDFVFWFNKKKKGWTKEEVGTSAPTADQRNRNIALEKVDPVLNSIAELSEKINTQQGIIAKISGGVEKAKAKANLDDDVSEYNSLISGFTPLVARAVGHSGVLTEQDVQSVRELFPKVGDSKTLRDRKISRIKFILGAVKNAGTPTTQKTVTEQDIDKMSKEELEAFLRGQ